LIGEDKVKDLESHEVVVTDRQAVMGEALGAAERAEAAVGGRGESKFEAD